MPCYHPIRAWRTASGITFHEDRRKGDQLGQLELACGQCIGCRLRRARDWSLRVMHEAQLHDSNCFVTLTYDDAHLPPGGHLRYADYQAFMRRLRKASKSPVRFFMCGEYGPLNLRPHYHACLFNIDFSDRVPLGKSGAGAVFYDSPTLRRIWGLGHVSVQPLCREAAEYTARYVVDKITGQAAESHYSTVDDDGVINRRPSEFSRCSLRPGIGYGWFQRYGRSDVFPADMVVSKGERHQVPRYYDKLLRRSTRTVSREGFIEARDDQAAGLVERIELDRFKRSKLNFQDQTSERLEVREAVQKARLNQSKRKDV